jgi:hypothetical protein
MHARSGSAVRRAKLTPFVCFSCTGFSRIENLDEYTGLKVIYLEGNGQIGTAPISTCAVERQS